MEGKLIEVKMGLYRHFEDGAYELFEIAEHCENGESLAIYRSVSRKRYLDNGIVYARPLDEFLAKVDKEKYPHVEQEYVFQYIGEMVHKEV